MTHTFTKWGHQSELWRGGGGGVLHLNVELQGMGLVDHLGVKKISCYKISTISISLKIKFEVKSITHIVKAFLIKNTTS